MIKIDTVKFVYNLILKGMKQTHLDENFDMMVYKEGDVPTKIKSKVRKISPIFGGSKSIVIVIRAKHDGVNVDTISGKFTRLIKNCIYGDPNNNSILDSEIVKLDTDDDEKTETSKDVYVFCCISFEIP